MKLVKLCLPLVLMSALAGLTFAEETPVEQEGESSSVVDRMKAIDEVNPKSWGIRNNCIAVSRIRGINFRDDQSAIVDVGRGKEVLMRLKRECNGIKIEGYMYKPRGIRLCARYDYLTLLRSKRICHIASFEPYLVVEEPENEETQP